MMNYLKEAKIKGKTMRFPIYFPDATRAVVRSLDNQDLKEAGIEGFILNSYHLMSMPGTRTIKKLGGMKKYMNWPGFAISDSGGWQLLSLIYKNKSFGKITDDGVVFFRGSKGKRKNYYFSPEKSIQVQMDLNTDIIICLDDCPGKNASKKQTELSTQRTIDWAKRCKIEYLKQIKKRKLSLKDRPLILAVVQGGQYKNLRKKCADELLKVGFDGYGLGGWLTDKTGKIDLDTIGFISKCLPDNLPKFALGVGYPQDIIDLTKLGYHIFDCVIPTRDARHKRLYAWAKNPDKADILKEKNLFKRFYPDKARYALDKKPVSRFCDCRLCQNYSRAYLYHLFKIGDSLAWRLATIHNLRLYTKLIELLRKNVK